jgi:hypothetical protein
MGSHVNKEDSKTQTNDVQGRPSEFNTAWDVADAVSGLACFMVSILDLMHDQSEVMMLAESKAQRIQADANLSTLFNCAGRYLKEIRAICEQAQAGGVR